MNITKESTGNLTAEIKVEISQNDYQDKLAKQLKDYQRKATVPGFRAGKVPFGIVQKMYGRAMKIEEVNKMISAALDNYIKENNIRILGNPLMNEEKNSEIDWDAQTDFEFYFEMAMQPEIKIDLEAMTLGSYKIIADEKMIDSYVKDAQKRQGHAQSHDIADENDIVHADAEELDETGNVKENGVKTKISFAIEKIVDKDIKASILGLKKDDFFDINFALALGSEHDASHLLNLEHEAEGLNSVYRIKALEISHLQDAELNEELFEKVYPGSEIKTIEGFRNKIKEAAENYYVNESDRKFLGDVFTKLIEETVVELPSDFLKKLLLSLNDNKFTSEQIEKDYNSYERSLRTQLIENKLITEYNINVNESEVRAYIKEFVLGQYFPTAQDEEQDNRLESIVDTLMKNEKELARIYEELSDKKILQLFKEKVKTTTTEIAFDEFIKLTAQNHNHNH